MIIKQSWKNTTHMFLSLLTTLLLEFTVMKQLVYLYMQYSSLPLKKFLWRGYWYRSASEHMLLCMMWSTQYMLVGQLTTFQWWGTLKYCSWEVVKIFVVYILWNVHCNRIVWWTQFMISKMPLQHTKFPLMRAEPVYQMHGLRCLARLIISFLVAIWSPYSLQYFVHNLVTYHTTLHAQRIQMVWKIMGCMKAEQGGSINANYQQAYACKHW